MNSVQLAPSTPIGVANAYSLLSVHRWEARPAAAVIAHIDAINAIPVLAGRYTLVNEVSVLPLLRYAATSDDDEVQRAAIDYAMLTIAHWYPDDAARLGAPGALTTFAIEHAQSHDRGDW